MARRVLKYHISAPMPTQHKFLCAGMQDYEIYVWLEGDDDYETDSVNIYIRIPTGYVTIRPGWSYRTSVRADDGLVWHIYDTRGA